MGRKATRGQQGRERERKRRLSAEHRRFEAGIEAEVTASDQAAAAGLDPDRLPDPAPALDLRPTPQPAGYRPSDSPSGSGKRIPGQQLSCGWCGTAIAVRSTGRLPKWCSASCRQRAWETDRAARSGQAAVRVVDRYIHAVPDTTDGWVEQLTKLAGQVEHQANLDTHMLAAVLDVIQTAIADRNRWADLRDPHGHRY